MTETEPENEPEVAPRTPSLARNLISYIGLVIAIVSVANIVFLVFAEFTGAHSKPYAGILAYMILPAIMILGLILVFVGMLVERRRRHFAAPDELARFPSIDLNRPKVRRTIVFSILAGIVFIFVSMLGSYRAYEYTDSDEFCGLLCHSVMHPEFIAYKASPHARVGCVDCHVGPGAGWYVRSKLSGAYQVYAVLFNKYPKPIPTPVRNLRPAQETCEQCHWPEKFFGGQLKVFNHFGYDERNTPRETQLLIKTGGGSPTSGLTTGIHWHMNIANEITYAPADEHQQKIPWVRLKDRFGRVTEYVSKDTDLKPEQITALPRKTMDCVACHNRPTHIYVPPDRSVDRAMLARRVSPDLPFIKAQAVMALTRPYKTTPEAIAAISRDITNYYAKTYPDVYKNHRAAVYASVKEVQQIFRTTLFPEMKVDWRTHPDNIGHLYFTGCFRCHDDQHVSQDGKVISKKCDACHVVMSQKESNTPMIEVQKTEFQHPVDLGDMTQFNCADCHTGAAMEQ